MELIITTAFKALTRIKGNSVGFGASFKLVNWAGDPKRVAFKSVTNEVAG
jgi:hypothetical protein